MNAPVPLGLRKSFAFGDRLGLATPGHLAAALRFPAFSPVFAHQSVREMALTRGSHSEVVSAARQALEAARFTGTWGADADQLTTPEEVRAVAAAGFCTFTIDAGEHVDNAADSMDEASLRTAVMRQEAQGLYAGFEWRDYYLDRVFSVGGGNVPLSFDEESLLRAMVKYGRATVHAEVLGQSVAAASGGRGEIGVAVHEAGSVTSPLEHLFLALELQRRGVLNLVSLALRFPDGFGAGVDAAGDLDRFESGLRVHAAIARFAGPYKLSICGGPEKFGVYPVIGRVCRERLHVSTAAASDLEALRVVARVKPALFAEITAFCRERFDSDRAVGRRTTAGAGVNALPVFHGASDEPAYLDEAAGRELLHLTLGCMLGSGTDHDGRPFKDGIREVLRGNPDLHCELVENHFVKHLSLLNAG